MKKVWFAFLMIVVLAVFPVAAANHATITISATIPDLFSILLTGSSTINVDPTMTFQSLGTIDLTTNSSRSFQLTFESLNKGFMKNGNIGLAYLFVYNGNNVGSLATKYTTIAYTTSLTAIALGISYSFTPEDIPAGIYTDVITISVISG